MELLSIRPAVTEIQTCFSPGKSPATQRCTACLETSAAILRNEHREHANNFKSSINSNRNGEDERKEDSASRKRNRWLLWSKKYNRKKWSRRTLFEGVKRQEGSLEKAKAQELGAQCRALHCPAEALVAGPGELLAPLVPETAAALPSPTTGTSRCQTRVSVTRSMEKEQPKKMMKKLS